MAHGIAGLATLSVVLAWVIAMSAGWGELELRWEAPAECPSGQEVRTQVMHLLTNAPEAQARVAARVVRRGREFEAELRVDYGGATATRYLRSPRCTTLAEVVAMYAAMAIDPEVSPWLPEPAEGPAPVAAQDPPVAAPEVVDADVREPARPPVVPPLPAPTTTVARPRERDRSGGLEGLIGVGVGADFNLLPGAGAATELWAGLGAARWRLALQGMWLPRRVLAASDDRLLATLGGLGMQGCGGGQRGRWGLWGCGGVRAGWARARARGADVADARAVTDPWVVAAVLTQGELDLGHGVGLYAAAEGRLGLLRPGWALAGAGERARLGAWGLQGTLGVLFRLRAQRK